MSLRLKRNITGCNARFVERQKQHIVIVRYRAAILPKVRAGLVKIERQEHCPPLGKEGRVIKVVRHTVSIFLCRGLCRRMSKSSSKRRRGPCAGAAARALHSFCILPSECDVKPQLAINVARAPP